MRQLKITKSITTRESASLDKYLQEISKEEMVSVEDEVELAQRIKGGDQKALEKLTKANLRFVVSVAKQYQNQGMSLPDLINEGNLGLIKAAQRFDEKRGFKFISYAVWWIRQSILQALAEHGRIIRLPLNQIGILTKLNKVLTELEQEHERYPTHEELSEVLDIPEKNIRDIVSNSARTISLDSPLDAENPDDGNLLDVIESREFGKHDSVLYLESLRKEIVRALNTLSAREAEVIRLYHGINQEHDWTLEEIGKEFDLTRERVRQIKEKALRKLKYSKKSKLLKQYLG